MRFLRFDDGAIPRFGRLDGGLVTPLDAAPWAGGRDAGERRPFETLALLPPVPAGGKVLCIGRNYFAHAKELGNEVPKEPLLFLKPSSSLIGPGDAIVLPAESKRVEHEAELGVVILGFARVRRLESTSRGECQVALPNERAAVANRSRRTFSF